MRHDDERNVTSTIWVERGEFEHPVRIRASICGEHVEILDWEYERAMTRHFSPMLELTEHEIDLAAETVLEDWYQSAEREMV